MLVFLLEMLLLPSSKRCIVQKCLTSRWFSMKCSLLILLSSVMWYLDTILVWKAFPEVLSYLSWESLGSLVLRFFTRIAHVSRRELKWWTLSSSFAFREVNLWYYWSASLIPPMFRVADPYVTPVILIYPLLSRCCLSKSSLPGSLSSHDLTSCSHLFAQGSHSKYPEKCIV